MWRTKTRFRVRCPAAVETVKKELKVFLGTQSWDNANFHTGLNLSALEQMNAQIAAARTLAGETCSTPVPARR